MKLEMRGVAVVLLGAVAAACGSTTGDGDEGAGGQGGESTASGGSSSGSGGGGRTGSGGSGQGGMGGEPSEEPCFPAGLSAYYEANGNVLEEVSSEAGELIGSAVADGGGKFDEAFSFPGTAAGHVVGADIDGDDFGSSDFSIAFWLSTGGGYVLDKRIFDEQGGVTGYHVYSYSGAIGLQIADGTHSNYNAAPSDVDVMDGEWHQIVISVDRDAADGLNFYVDGVLTDTQNPTAHQGSTDNASPLIMGGHVQELDQPVFSGSLDEVQLYKRALTADEAEYLADHATLPATCD